MEKERSLEERIAALQERLEKNPGVILEILQERYALSMAQIIESLPVDLWKKVDGTHFIDVLQNIATIGNIVVITNTADAILEFKGPFPPGEFSHGFYNLQGEKVGLHGHLKPDRCKSIYFIERPFMKKITASIIFVNPEGNVSFKIFLGRDETGEIDAQQLVAFRNMAQITEVIAE